MPRKFHRCCTDCGCSSERLVDQYAVRMGVCATAAWNCESQGAVCFFNLKLLASVKVRPIHCHGRVRQAWDCGVLYLSGPCLHVCMCVLMPVRWCSYVLRFHALLPSLPNARLPNCPDLVTKSSLCCIAVPIRAKTSTRLRD